MNPTKGNTTFFEILETIINGETEEFREILRFLYNQAMRLERNHYLQAAPYERNDSRKGYANGYKPKTLNTRFGPVRVEIPQVRGLNFYPRSLEKGSRSEKALKLAIADLPVRQAGWREFLESLVKRGLYGIKLITSDDRQGPTVARKKVFTSGH